MVSTPQRRWKRWSTHQSDIARRTLRELTSTPCGALPVRVRAKKSPACDEEPGHDS